MTCALRSKYFYLSVEPSERWTEQTKIVWGLARLFVKLHSPNLFPQFVLPARIYNLVMAYRQLTHSFLLRGGQQKGEAVIDNGFLAIRIYWLMFKRALWRPNLVLCFGNIRNSYCNNANGIRLGAIVKNLIINAASNCSRKVWCVHCIVIYDDPKF